MDAGDEDFVYFGSALERAEDLSKRKQRLAVADGRAKQLPVWQQEVTDSEGRRRFHGAFTGGFSAGYFNTVGSKEGWAPASFSSSRKQRAAQRPQKVADFLDADEKEEATREAFTAAAQFDTFGFTANEVARRQAQQDEARRPSAFPQGGGLEELLAPASASIGVHLLRRMGWREGRQLGPAHAVARPEVLREGRRATWALAAAQAAGGGAAEGGGAQGRGEGGHEEGPRQAALEGGEGRPAVGPGSSLELRAGLTPAAPPGAAAEAAAAVPSLAAVEAAVAAALRAAKRDSHGLGYDPFSGAEDVRALRRPSSSTRGAAPGSMPAEERRLALVAAPAAPPASGGGGVAEGWRDGWGGGAGGGSGGAVLLRGSGRDNGRQRRMAAGFGIGALEEAGAEDEDVYDAGPRSLLAREVVEEEEEADEARPARGRRPMDGRQQRPEERLRAAGQGLFGSGEGAADGSGALLGICLGSSAVDAAAWYPPPKIPTNFVPRHVFPPAPPTLPPAAPAPPSLAPLGVPLAAAAAAAATTVAAAASSPPPPPPAPPPASPFLRAAIDGTALLVARGGAPLELLAMQRAARSLPGQPGEAGGLAPSAPPPSSSSFLLGGEGSAYFRRRVWELRRAEREREREAQGAGAAAPTSAPPPLPPRGAGPAADAGAAGQLAVASGHAAPQRLSPDRRGALLGEQPLRSAAPPAAPAPAPQLPPPAAAPPSRPPAPPPNSAAAQLAAMMAARFRSGGAEEVSLKPGICAGGGAAEGAGGAAAGGAAREAGAAAASVGAGGGRPEAVAPQRSEERWRPLPLVCRRFNVSDPYAGKAAPLVVPRRSATPTLDALLPLAPAPPAVPAGQPVASAAAGLPPQPPPAHSKQPAASGSGPAGAAAAGEWGAGSPAGAGGGLGPAAAPPGSSGAEGGGAEGSVGAEALAERAAAMAVGKPLDLFKAIFSSDEDSDGDGRQQQQQQQQQPPLGNALGLLPSQAATGQEGRAAAQAGVAEAAGRALARLEAGDFLEELGRELGMEVGGGEEEEEEKKEQGRGNDQGQRGKGSGGAFHRFFVQRKDSRAGGREKQKSKEGGGKEEGEGGKDGNGKVEGEKDEGGRENGAPVSMDHLGEDGEGAKHKARVEEELVVSEDSSDSGERRKKKYKRKKKRREQKQRGGSDSDDSDSDSSERKRKRREKKKRRQRRRKGNSHHRSSGSSGGSTDTDSSEDKRDRRRKKKKKRRKRDEK